MLGRNTGNLVHPFIGITVQMMRGLATLRGMVTLLYPRFVEFLYFDIQSSGQKSLTSLGDLGIFFKLKDWDSPN